MKENSGKYSCFCLSLFHFFAKKVRMKHTKDNEMPGTE